MQDADAVLEKFFYYCHLAQDACAIFREGDDGPEPIKERYEQVMTKLRAEPLTVVSALGHMPIVLLEADIKKTLFTALYSPVKIFPLVADFLNRLYNGDDISDMVIAPDLGFMCDAKFKLLIYPGESSSAIGCSDQRYKVGRKHWNEVGETPSLTRRPFWQRNETLEEVFGKVYEYTKSFADVVSCTCTPT